MSGDFSVEDLAAMRRDGSRGELFRFLISEGAARKNPAAPAPALRPPGRVPGAWPPLTTPPGPNVAPAGDWAAALAEHRAWHLAGCPPGPSRCECPACLINAAKETP